MEEMRVLVVDDDSLQRQALVRIVGNAPGFTVVAEAEDGRDALARYSDHAPDVVLMDLMMPVMTGVEATKRLMELDPAAKVVVMTSLVTEEYLVPALTAGACGYLTKGLDSHDLLNALRGAVQGELKLSSAVVRSLVDMVVLNGRSDPKPVGSAQGSGLGGRLRGRTATATRRGPAVELTEREQSIIERLAWGCSNAEMAKDLFISEATVKANLARLMAKLQAENRVQVLVKAVRLGLVALDVPAVRS